MLRFTINIIFLFAFLLGNGQTSISYTGEIPSSFDYQIDSSYSSEKDLKESLALLQQEAFEKGHLSFSINNLTKIDSVNFSGDIEIGPQFFWNKINLNVKGPELPNYLVPKLKNKNVSPKSIANYYQNTLDYYQNNGFPFAEIKFDSLSLNDSILSGNILIDAKQRILFDSLEIIGKPKLKKYYLENYLGVKKGHLYSEKEVKSINKKIKELPFVTLQSTPRVKFSNNKAITTLKLKHKPANFINGIIGVLPNSNSKLVGGDQSKLVITGDLKLNLGNVFQRGEKIKLNWKRIQTETQQLETSFEFPYVAKTMFGLSHELDLLKQDTSYVNYTNKLGIVYALGAKRSLKAFWENSGTNKLSNEPISQTNLTSTNGSLNSYGLEFFMDERDYKYNPRKGYLVQLEAKAGLKKLTGKLIGDKILIPISEETEVSTSIYAPENSTVYSGKFRAELFIPVAKVMAIKVGAQSATIMNNYLLDNDLLRLGGFNLMRGFDEQSLFASTFAVATLEYRILFEQNSHLALFFDQGYLQKSTLIEHTDDFPFGFGAGVNFQTKPGIFSVSYAVGKQNENPIDFSASKIHFGFINLF